MASFFCGFLWSRESFRFITIIKIVFSAVEIRNISADSCWPNVAAYCFAKWLLSWLKSCLIWQIEYGWCEILVLLATVKRHSLGLRRTILNSTWGSATFKNGSCRLLSLLARKTSLTLSAWLRWFWASGLWSRSLTWRAGPTHSLRRVLWNRIVCLEPGIVINFVLSLVALFIL